MGKGGTEQERTHRAWNEVQCFLARGGKEKNPATKEQWCLCIQGVCWTKGDD